MKKIVLLFIISTSLSVNAQEFAKLLSDAKSAYAAGKLDDARFAMQQMLQELDIITGKEVLKILPSKMDVKAANMKKDNVSGSSGFFGVVIHREYGMEEPGNIVLEIIVNSPMIGTLNSLLSLPMMGSSGDQKVIRISGYKALVQKVQGENDRSDYEVQLPLNNSLITLRAPGLAEEQVTKLANTLPVSELAKLLQ